MVVLYPQSLKDGSTLSTKIIEMVVFYAQNRKDYSTLYTNIIKIVAFFLQMIDMFYNYLYDSDLAQVG
jgi:hypothetical protein